MKLAHLLLVLIGVAALAAPAAAQPVLDADWYTIDGGGALGSSGGIFDVSGTIGQPDAGDLNGGEFSVSGGFWYAGIGAAPTCDPDINCDGSADQDDVSCLIDVIAGNPGCDCQDADFNRDGNVDQSDVEAVINVVAGGGCP